MKCFSKSAFATLAAAAVTLSAGMATAATMTFSSLPDEGALLTSYTENGITATSGSGTLGWYTSPGAAHVDDSGTGFTDDITFTTGGVFDAANFSLTSLGFNILGPQTPPSDTIFVTGYLGGSLVSMLDAFTITLLYPRGIPTCDAPCSHFDLNSVTLAPVPLPASMTLMGAAGIALVGLRRRRKA